MNKTPRRRRALSAGRLLYLLWYKPRAAVHRTRREGGPWQQWLNARGRSAMMKAAGGLPPRAPKPGAPEVCFLTGKRFWFQTAFCCWSLCQHTEDEVMPVFLDDGTLDEEIRRECQRVFPGARVMSAPEIEERLDRHLPAARFPALRGQRKTYIHLRKLTDAHAGRVGWRVVLDSDMLFFRTPDALVHWLDAPDRPLHMRDVNDAYGYSYAEVQALVGAPVPHEINVGITGLRSDMIDWDQLERWCAEIVRKHGTSYYLEQALVAMAMAGHDTLCLPREDYIVMPTEAEAADPTAPLHHYVDLSKRGYFRHAWRHVVPQAATTDSIR